MKTAREIVDRTYGTDNVEDLSDFTISLSATIHMMKQYAAQPKGISVEEQLPEELESVWISNGKGWTALGCLVRVEDGWHWAESNGIIYEENNKIVTECESDDLEVNFWHPLPTAPEK